MTVYGYARVSTRDQDLIAQDAELMAAGCAKVFKEKVSGTKTDRPELAKVSITPARPARSKMPSGMWRANGPMRS